MFKRHFRWRCRHGFLKSLLETLSSEDDVEKSNLTMGHFTVVYSVTGPMNGSEAAGDLVLIQTSLFLSCKSCCCDAN